MASLEQYKEWQLKHNTHADRLVDIIKRYFNKAKQWEDAMRLYPTASFEGKIIFDRLAGEFKSLSEEAVETVEILMEDELSLIKVFQSLQKELNEQSNEKDKKWT